MADYAWRQRLGRGDAPPPASSDWREYLHHEGREDDRKKLPQPPTHESSHLLTKKLIMRADGCRAGTTRPYFATGTRGMSRRISLRLKFRVAKSRSFRKLLEI